MNLKPWDRKQCRRCRRNKAMFNSVYCERCKKAIKP